MPIIILCVGRRVNQTLATVNNCTDREELHQPLQESSSDRTKFYDIPASLPQHSPFHCNASTPLFGHFCCLSHDADCKRNSQDTATLPVYLAMGTSSSLRLVIKEAGLWSVISQHAASHSALILKVASVPDKADGWKSTPISWKMAFT